MTKFLRTAQAKWDKRHLLTVSTHLTRSQYDRLRYYTALNGVKPYAIVRDFLLRYIRQQEAQEWEQSQKRISAEEEWWRSSMGL